MIAVETNILVYAHRTDSLWHQAADAAVVERAESGEPWAIPWPCIHEFLAVVTHPRIYDPPTPLADAIEQLACWFEVPTLMLLGEGPGYWDVLRRVVKRSRIVGPRVHDARIVALCLHHGVREIWTADRDFRRFDGLAATNPLIRGG